MSSSFFNRERFGVPQLIGAVLLLFLLAQCAWFIAYVPLTQTEATYVRGGLDYVSRQAVVFDSMRSPLISLMASLPLRILHPDAGGKYYDQFYLDSHRWLIRLPFVISGLLLGASLWYVARRLYGNTGGYIALGLYAFNPAVVSHISFASPEVIAAWGAFGAVFTAIAVAHTLYAPREVVLWNWRRILLLGFCIYLMVGAQFSTAILLLLALGFMLWAVPHRRGAALAIFGASGVVAFAMLLFAYLFRFGDFRHGLETAQWFRFSGQALLSPLVYRSASFFYLREAPGPVFLFLLALFAYLPWRRARFFGNTAPLLVVVLLLLVAFAMPGFAGYTLYFVALPFIMLFSSGVLTDVLENPRLDWALGIVMGVLLTQGVVGFMGLAHLSRSSR
jgi:hypothetical protein